MEVHRGKMTEKREYYSVLHDSASPRWSVTPSSVKQFLSPLYTEGIEASRV
uniref:Uncharacterized protein n=3 Tax=Cercopithecidae TaxID=9527 RepID=A0A2K5XEK5_MANLE|nr:unnamed protein product [Macaca fascicularis]